MTGFRVCLLSLVLPFTALAGTTIYENSRHDMAAGDFGICWVSGGNVVRSTGSGAVATLLTGVNPTKMIGADMDGDGKQELVYLLGGQIYYYNFVTGSTTGPISGPTGAQLSDLTAGVFKNGETRDFLMVTNGSGGSGSLYSFDPSSNGFTNFFGSGIRSLARGNFLPDTAVDEFLLVLNTNAAVAFKPNGFGGGTFSSVAGGMAAGVGADLTSAAGDETWQVSTTNAVTVNENVVAGSTPISTGLTAAANTSVATGNFDGAGLKEGAVIGADGRISIYSNATGVTTPTSGNADFASLIFVDFDHDGTDELFALRNGDRSQLWRYDVQRESGFVVLTAPSALVPGSQLRIESGAVDNMFPDFAAGAFLAGTVSGSLKVANLNGSAGTLGNGSVTVEACTTAGLAWLQTVGNPTPSSGGGGSNYSGPDAATRNNIANSGFSGTNGWSLRFAGLTAGARYRLQFLTSELFTSTNHRNFDIYVGAAQAFDNYDPPASGDAPYSSIVQFEVIAEASGTVTVTFQPGSTTVTTDTNPYINAVAIAKVDTTPPPAGIVAINEFLAGNSGGLKDEDGESPDWIEIYNGLDTPQNMAGWRLTDDATDLAKWVFPATIIPPRSFLVVFASSKNRAVAGSTLHTNFSLSGNGEYLGLINAAGEVVSHYSPKYPAQATNVSYGPATPITVNEPPGSAAFAALQRYFTAPTPGGVNATGTTALGPYVDDLTHLPTIPADAENLVVTARVTASFGPISTVTMRYRINYGTELVQTMFDDGAHGDGVAGDSIFGAVISASLSTPGQMIRYSITATDTGGRATRAPLFVNPTGADEYFGTVVANPAISANVPVLQWFVESPALADTATGTHCSIFYLGELYDNVDIRIRGNTSRGYPKKSYKLKFNDDHEFRFKIDVPRVDEINLNTTYTDQSYNRSVLTYQTFADAGLPVPEISHVHVRQNGAFFSVALLTEQIQGSMLERWGLDKRATLYKAGSGSDYEDIYSFEKNTREEEGTGDLSALIASLKLTGAARDTFVFDEVDIPAMINYIASLCIVQDQDGTDKNHYLYRDINGTKEWRMIPYDLDLTWGPKGLNNDTIVYNEQSPTWLSHPYLGARPYVNSSEKYNRLMEAVIYNTRAKAMILRRLRTLTDANLVSGLATSRVNALTTLILSDAAQDRAKWGGSAQFSTLYTPQQSNDRIRNEYITPRIGFLTGTSITDIGSANPASQPAAPPINIGTVEFAPPSGNQNEEYIVFTNPNTFAVDLSGWTLSGQVLWPFKPGTVLPAGESLYLSPNPAAFRTRAVSPKGGEQRFVQGGYAGQLSARGGDLILKNGALPTSTTIATKTYTGTPTLAQQFLRITEVHYAPTAAASSNPGDYEFIELRNLGAAPLSLNGVKISGGVDFNFTNSAITTLAPGAYALVVKNPAAFALRYGSGLPVAGTFTGQLNNAGDRIHLTDAVGENVLDFTYSPLWQPLTDGGGFSLTVASETQDYTAWDTAAGWKPSGKLGGTPGTGDVEFDSDSDGLPDLWEAEHGYVPTNGADGAADDDSDGQSNAAEYTAGTDPRDPTSRFQINSVAKSGDSQLQITFSAMAGHTYALQSTTNLRDPASWATVRTEPAGDSRPVTFTESIGSSPKFYRVITPAP